MNLQHHDVLETSLLHFFGGMFSGEVKTRPIDIIRAEKQSSTKPGSTRHAGLQTS